MEEPTLESIRGWMEAAKKGRCRESLLEIDEMHTEVQQLSMLKQGLAAQSAGI